MAVSEKKILCPVLYPKDRSLSSQWFIKYKTPDWEKGGFKYEKYTGLLNRVTTVQEREELAATYLKMMQKGDVLPSYQGMRNTPAVVEARSETNVVYCCERYLNHKRADDKDAATIAQYKSKFNKFYKWLRQKGKDKLAIGGITQTDAEDFLIFLKVKERICNGSINNYKSLLASVWSSYKRNIRENPWMEIKAKKHTTQHLKSFPIELQAKMNTTLPAYNRQLWLFMQTVYYCAIRPHQELRLMKIKHIDFEAGLFTVPKEIAKNDKERRVNIFHKLIEQFKESSYHLCDPEYYIFSHGGQPGPNRVGKNFFSMRWDEYRKAHKIDAGYKLYGSKHTGGKKLTKKMNAYITKEHYGHGSMQQTEHYISDLHVNELKKLQHEFPEFASTD